MTLGDLLFGAMLSSGFFISAIVARFFRGAGAGIFIGGVAGLGVSVFLLVYGLSSELAPTLTPVE